MFPEHAIDAQADAALGPLPARGSPAPNENPEEQKKLDEEFAKKKNLRLLKTLKSLAASQPYLKRPRPCMSGQPAFSASS